jgi:phosphonate metabolism protein (transferase hexapeptide repeat family)
MKVLGPAPFFHDDSPRRNSQFEEYTEIGPRNYFENSQLRRFGYTGPDCWFQNTEIGPFANIAASVRVGPTSHPMDRPTQHHFTYRRKMFGLAAEDDEAFFQWRAQQRTSLGADTWLGHGCIVMPGVKIGHGVVVGAGAVVTRDLPDYAIAVGVPAKVVRFRFPEATRQALISLAWWDWPYDKIKAHLEDFSGTTEEFLAKFSGQKDQGKQSLNLASSTGGLS